MAYKRKTKDVFVVYFNNVLKFKGDVFCEEYLLESYEDAKKVVNFLVQLEESLEGKNGLGSLFRRYYCCKEIRVPIDEKTTDVYRATIEIIKNYY